MLDFYKQAGGFELWRAEWAGKLVADTELNRNKNLVYR